MIKRLDFGGFILLRPEVLSRYAAAVVRKVRKHPQELGCIREDELLAGDLDYQDFKRLPREDEAVVLRTLLETFISRAWCLRQPCDSSAMLTFPSYFRRERKEQPSHPSVLVTYRFDGPVDDIYATCQRLRDHGVTRHGKRELRLVRVDAVHAVHDQRRNIEHNCHRAQPGLIAMLRAEVKQHGIGNVARQQVGAPALPVAKNLVEHGLFGTAPQPPQKLSGARRRPGPRIEQRNLNLARGKGIVDNRQISDHNSEEREAHARFHHGEGAGGSVVGRDVSVAQREESFATKIDDFPERDFFIAQRQMFAQSVLHAGESKNQAERPKTHQWNQRQRPKVRQKAFAPVGGLDMPPPPGPEAPAIPVEPPRDAKTAFDAPR